jgi:glycine oxidase
MVGPTAVTGLVVATGHYRNGILLAPLTATTVVSVLDGAAGWDDGPFARFGPDRFTGGRATSPDAGGLAPVGR